MIKEFLQLKCKLKQKPVEKPVEQWQQQLFTVVSVSMQWVYNVFQNTDIYNFSPRQSLGSFEAWPINEPSPPNIEYKQSKKKKSWHDCILSTVSFKLNRALEGWSERQQQHDASTQPVFASFVVMPSARSVSIQVKHHNSKRFLKLAL